MSGLHARLLAAAEATLTEAPPAPPSFAAPLFNRGSGALLRALRAFRFEFLFQFNAFDEWRERQRATRTEFLPQEKKGDQKTR
jgi:hypothetical protein